MKKSLPIILTITFLAIALGVYATRNTSNESMTTDSSNDAMTQEEASMSDESMEENSAMENDSMMEESAKEENGKYLDYSAELFAEYRNKKRVYFFFAPWCPTCVPTDKEISANTELIPEDVAIFKTDYDSSDELKSRYNVTYQHTFVQVDSEGNEVAKWNGGGIEEIISNIK